LAKVASWEGNQQEALAQYEAVLRRAPGLYDAIVGKAFSLLWMGRSADARTLLHEAARQHPDDREVRDALREMGEADSDAKSIAETPTAPTSSARPERSEKKAAEPSSAKFPAAAKKKIDVEAGARSGVLRDRLSDERSMESNSATGELVPRSPEPPSNPVEPQSAPTESPADAPRPSSRWRPLVLIGILAVIAFLAWRYLGRPRRREMQIEPAPAQPARKFATATEAARVIPAHSPPPEPRLDEEPTTTTEDTPIDQTVPQPVEVVLPAVTPAHTLAGRQVLLVGANDAVLEVERRALNRVGALIAISSTLQEAVDCADQAPPAVVVLNAAIDGTWTSLTAIAWMSAHRPDLQAKSLVVLSVPDEASVEFCRKLATPYLDQPFDIGEFLEAASGVATRADRQLQEAKGA
jgi:ActR/RegA family two-component response regulator